jgi:hypothetical protein
MDKNIQANELIVTVKRMQKTKEWNPCRSQYILQHDFRTGTAVVSTASFGEAPLSLSRQQPSQSPSHPQVPRQPHEPPQHSFRSSTGLPPGVGGGGTRSASARNVSSIGDFTWNPELPLRSITRSD